MKKSQNSVEQIKIPSKYYFKPIKKSLIITCVIIFGLIIQKICSTELFKFCLNFFSIGITFSLTFIAFSITALALLQLLQSKEWFSEVTKSVYFKSFLKRFLNSVKYCLFLFVSLLIFFVVINIKNIILCYITLSIFLIGMLFIIFWTWDCIADFIKLFK